MAQLLEVGETETVRAATRARAVEIVADGEDELEKGAQLGRRSHLLARVAKRLRVVGEPLAPLVEMLRHLDRAEPCLDLAHLPKGEEEAFDAPEGRRVGVLCGLTHQLRLLRGG